MKSDPLSETRLTDQQYRKNQTLFPQTFAEHFFIYKTHLILLSLMKIAGKIVGNIGYNRAKFTPADLTQADLTRGRVDPHSPGALRRCHLRFRLVTLWRGQKVKYH